MPIKSYSPELIVHGCLRSSTALRDAGDTGNTEHERQADAVSKWFPALSALVVGPGLGRDETLQSVAALVIERAVAARLPCVIDADGLRVVMERPELIAGSQWTVLTPNRPEFGRMREKFALEQQHGRAVSTILRARLNKKKARSAQCLNVDSTLEPHAISNHLHGHLLL